MTRRVVLATANPDKAREIATILGGEDLDLELVARPSSVPEVEETGASLRENARIKAQALVRATDTAALADDTGLEVDPLGGAPGIRSARYAGDGASDADNVARLLAELASLTRTTRTARFRTVVVLADPDGAELAAEGVVEGTISDAPRGSFGFGYDPVFQPAGAGGRTFAELGEDEKAAISHRGRALRALATRMRDAGADPTRGD
ncbi:MAG TPA: RdgB/HAM1 family non-canonical purine NTP pyrophosphatase [Acidimicrobiia bacterium]|nr:RdgB/HAM1 family non-canonical purine NTP pyrophosphatase [Acidimicrobiia bacterium]